MRAWLAWSCLYVLEDKHMDDTLNKTNSFWAMKRSFSTEWQAVDGIAARSRIEFKNHSDVSRIEQDCRHSLAEGSYCSFKLLLYWATG
jgi:hypothetical protein